jgi:hypothetical protein
VYRRVYCKALIVRGGVVALCSRSSDIVRAAGSGEWRQVGEVASCVMSSVLRSMEGKGAASKPMIRPETNRTS